MDDHRTLALLAALALAFVHLLAGRMRFLAGIPRSHWLSAAGGVSVAYVFLHLLPELASGQTDVRGAVGPVLGVVERHVYLVALVGLAVFHGLDHLALRSRRRHERQEGRDRTTSGVFWVHIGSFAVYNLLVGYLLVHRDEETTRGLLMFTFAMGLHFLVNDFSLWEHHKARYSRAGRWIIAVAVLLGWAIGAGTRVHPALVAALLAFVAGGVILNVLKEEVPEDRQSRFWAFATGIAGYGAVLLSM